ncbi:MAG: permease [Verrucomicrobiae bacterium]|nr:permease [Verrucomicrobiae bacterium]
MDSSGLNSFTDFCYLFLSIVLEGAPFIFFGTLISGFIDAYLPPGLIDRWLPKNRHLAVIVSALLGAIFPVCECAIVPVIRRLIRKGLPVSCAITYMLSAPIINPIVMISTYNAFSTSQGKFLLRQIDEAGTAGPLFVTLSRIGIAFIVTVGMGWLVIKKRNDSILRPELAKDIETPKFRPVSATGATMQGIGVTSPTTAKTEEPTPSHSDRLIHAMRTAMRDFVDTGMYFSIGVAITSLFKAYVTDDLVVLFNQSEYIGVNLMMVLAFVLSLCSTSDAFIAANFPVPLSAKLAFLVFGPMMDVKLVFMYLSVFKRRFVTGMAIGLFLVIGALCYFWIHVI